MQTLKRSLLIAFLVKATAGAGQPADSLTRALQIHPARDTGRITTLLRLSDATVYTDPGTAMRYADEALTIADSLQWAKGLALAQRQKGNVYYVFSDNTSAMDWYVKALRTSRTLHNRELDASLFNNLANIYSDLKQYDKALDYYRQFLATAREAGSAKEEVIALVNLATVYSELNAQDTALNCNRQALDIARRGGITGGTRLVLVGIGVAAMLGGVNDYLMTRANISDAAQAAVWITGSLDGSTWSSVVLLAVASAILMPCVILTSRALRILEMGDDLAIGLGIPAERLRLFALAGAVVLAATAASQTGPVAFVALCAPHVARKLTRATGPNLVPSLLVGAVLLVGADWLARYGIPDRELPVGAVTGLLGGGYLAYLLAQQRRTGRI